MAAQRLGTADTSACTLLHQLVHDIAQLTPRWLWNIDEVNPNSSGT
jgi:hypothetical protein